MNYWIIALVLIMLGACKPAYHSDKPNNSDGMAPSGMIFLSFSVTSDSSKSRIELLGKKFIDKSLKVGTVDSNLEDRLVVKQLGKDFRELSSCAVDHPLFKRAEFSDEQGKLERKLVTLTRAEFFVRIPFHPQTEYVRVEEIVGNKNISATIFKLNQ